MDYNCSNRAGLAWLTEQSSTNMQQYLWMDSFLDVKEGIESVTCFFSPTRESVTCCHLPIGLEMFNYYIYSLVGRKIIGISCI